MHQQPGETLLLVGVGGDRVQQHDGAVVAALVPLQTDELVTRPQLEPFAAGIVAQRGLRIEGEGRRGNRNLGTHISTVAPPARDGWDAVANLVYETTTAEQRSVWATARRKGDTWYVSLFDGTKAGWGRRFPQAQIADKSLRVPGLVRESFLGKPAHALDAGRLAALRAFLVEAQRQLQIPGLAIAVVQGGEVVLAEGLGVRQLGKRAPVTADTLFRVASMSKPLTTLMMARLVDEGAFTWDTPAAALLPGFALGDPETTRKLTMKYTVCACTGLPRQDLEAIFDGAGKTPERMLAGMQRMTPTTGFGETFQYNNQMVAAGGAVTLLPTLALPVENRRHALRVRPFASKAPFRTIVLAWRPGSALATTLRTIGDTLRSAYPQSKP